MNSLLLRRNAFGGFNEYIFFTTAYYNLRTFLMEQLSDLKADSSSSTGYYGGLAIELTNYLYLFNLYFSVTKE